MPDNNGNGKQKQINGLKHEDDLINNKLDALKLSVDNLAKDFKTFISPDGVCDRHRSRTDKFMTQVSVQWWFIGGVVMGIIGLVFALLKSSAAG